MQNTQIITFTQSCIDQKWYARIPNYPGSHSDLEMVEGAEDLLTIESEGLRVVQMKISIEPDDQAPMVFHKIDETKDEKGANYQLIRNGYPTHKIWLCGVMEHVFQGFPETLYVTTIDLHDKLKEKAKSFFSEHFQRQTPWVDVVPFSLVNWKDMTPHHAEYFEEDIMNQAEALTGWPLDEVDLWRRLAQKKCYFSLSLLKNALDQEAIKSLEVLEERLQEKSVSKMDQLWWDIAHFLKKEN